MFGGHSINIHNWPEGVPFPPINVEDLDDKILGKSQGAEAKTVWNQRTVLQLPSLDLLLLAKALHDPDYPLHFKIYTDGLATGT